MILPKDQKGFIALPVALGIAVAGALVLSYSQTNEKSIQTEKSQASSFEIKIGEETPFVAYTAQPQGTVLATTDTQTDTTSSTSVTTSTTIEPNLNQGDSDYLLKVGNSGEFTVDNSGNANAEGTVLGEEGVGVGSLDEKPSEEDVAENSGLLYTREDGEDLFFVNSDGDKTRLTGDTFWEDDGSAVILTNDYYILEVSPDDSDARLVLDAADGDDSLIYFKEGGSNRWTFFSDAADGDKIKFYNDPDSETYLTLDGDGNLTVAGSLYTEQGRLVFGDSTSDGEYIYQQLNDIKIRADGNTVLTVDGDGSNIGIGTETPSASLDIDSDTLRLRDNKTPSSASADCDQGEIAWDDSYFYVCVSDDAWERAAHASW